MIQDTDIALTTISLAQHQLFVRRRRLAGKSWTSTPEQEQRIVRLAEEYEALANEVTGEKA